MIKIDWEKAPCVPSTMKEVERQIAEQFQPGSVIEYDPKKGFPRLDSRTQDPDRALKAQMVATMLGEVGFSMGCGTGNEERSRIERAANRTEAILAEIDSRWKEKGK